MAGKPDRVLEYLAEIVSELKKLNTTAEDISRKMDEET